MSEILSCLSCGATNQLPDGKASMFCAYCGGKIEKINNTNNSTQNPLRFKPEISKKKTEKRRDQEMYFDHNNNVKFYDGEEYEVITDNGGELSLIDRGISKLGEIIEWFSDNELSEIITLNLTRNKIFNLEGIDRFSGVLEIDMSKNFIDDISQFKFFEEGSEFDVINLSSNKIKSTKGLGRIIISKKLILTNNEIEIIEEFPLFNPETSIIDIDFSNNINLKQFSEKLITNLNNREFKKFGRINFKFKNCKSFDLSQLMNLRFSMFSSIFITLDKKDEYKNILKNKGFTIFSDDEKHTTYRLIPSETGFKCKKCGKKIHNKRIYDEQKGLCGNCKNACFIATATMGSYDHPDVLTLRNFRDNWILSKNWGMSFVEWYYHYGAIAAKFIERNNILKIISYILIVKPLVLLSRIISNKN